MYNPITRSTAPADSGLPTRPATPHANLGRVAVFVGAATAAAGLVLCAPIPSATAASCPGAEVVFARGTGEPPGLGDVGQAFVDALRPRVIGKSLGVYPVNYPASMDFPTALEGINDAGDHIEQMAVNCPNTRMVLGGYSQGAAVMGFVTSASIPDGAPPNAPQPMPADVADHVAAVALFGTPTGRFMNVIGAPPLAIGPLYAAKTKEFCAAGDPICSDAGTDWAAHRQYSGAETVDRAAAFAADHL